MQKKGNVLNFSTSLCIDKVATKDRVLEKMQKRFILILFSVIILSSTGTSDELEQRPITELIEAARQAKDQRDDKKFDEITGQIYERVTGSDILTREVPEGVTADEFSERLCAYEKVTSSLYTPSEIDLLRHAWRLIDYGLVSGPEVSKSIRASMSCALDNGELVPKAKALRDARSWSKKLKAASLSEALEMVREYEMLFEKHPDNGVYLAIADLIRQEIYEGPLAKIAERFSEEDLRFQRDLVQSARNGDAAEQLKLAQHLEEGSRFIQGNAKAYFWYKRALQNGGGQPAQTAVGRLYPQLSKLDLGYISFWTGLNSDPY